MVSMENMRFGYGKEALFDGLSLKMERGNIYGLLGLNGAGKTSLLRLIAGLLFPNSGTIRVLDGEPARREPGWLSRIYMIPEELNTPSVSEKEYIAGRAPFYPNFNFDQLERCLAEFEVPRNRRLNKLSHGQKKKFFLAFGLASGSEILILDEPTNGLDIPTKILFRRLVAEAMSDNRLVIISTHQVRDVDSLIDPITILHSGKVIFEHSMAEVQQGIHITRTPAPPDSSTEGLLYTQSAVGGYWNVWAGPDEENGPIDLEILFNTIISKPDIVSNLLSAKGEQV
ncbi:MAG: hypothetical protein B0D92_06770 [Spirochaeta sp. LUC14_002_19_P3]|nr:MAG: hypothetical protein B0D92_06770 [Spirochaeta sp. LUC14_002_19_P3]